MSSKPIPKIPAHLSAELYPFVTFNQRKRETRVLWVAEIKKDEMSFSLLSRNNLLSKRAVYE